MTEEQYRTTQQQIVALASLVYDLDLQGFLDMAVRSQATGSYLDPTLYQKAGGNLDAMIRLTAALKPFQQEIRRQMEGGVHLCESSTPDTSIS